MATPRTWAERYDGIHDWAGHYIRDAINRSYLGRAAHILDVGAGWGKYRDLLPAHRMDAVEVWEPYVEQEKLVDRYDTVFVDDIYDLVRNKDWAKYHWDVIILGDVLEHLSPAKAKTVIKKCVAACDQIYVVIPFEYPQGEVDDNPYERHLQDDLTVDVMHTRYPQLVIAEIEHRNGEPFKGIYLKRRSSK